MQHQPVLYHEIIHALKPQTGGRYVDCTLGAGGHSSGILAASSPHGLLLGLDVDPQALELSRNALAKFQDRVVIRQSSYTDLSCELADLKWHAVDGILLDLGASSMQFDTPQRGFSFQNDGKLDMRFDPLNPITASHLVNDLPEDELADLIHEFGEERFSRRIASMIVRSRPIHSTTQLASVIASANPGHPRLNPATRTFQALRISVNDELGSLRKVLPQAMQALNTGGRLAVISFHSLEDRIVKTYFRQESRDCLCPPRQPVCTCGHKAQVILVNRQPITPGEDEIQNNPRSRSAKLRIAEKRTSVQQ